MEEAKETPSAPAHKLLFKLRAVTLFEFEISDNETLAEIRPLLAEHPFLKLYPHFRFRHQTTLLKESLPLKEQIKTEGAESKIEVVFDQFNPRTAEVHIYQSALFFLKPEKYLSEGFLEFNLVQGKTDFLQSLVEQQTFKGHTLPFQEYVSNDLHVLKQLSFLDKEKNDNGFFQILRFSKNNPISNVQKTSGDFFMLDLVTLEGASFCLTVGKGGVYVNSLSETQGDYKYCSSIFDFLKQVSARAETQISNYMNFDSPEEIQEYSKVRIVSEGLLDNSLSWSEEPEKLNERSKGLLVLTKMFSHKTIGRSDRTFRDWNEDLQNFKSIPSKDISQLLQKAKYMRKFLEEFADASKEFTKAIVNEEILPLNQTDKTDENCYVFNNLFGTYAAESKFWEVPKSETAPTTYSTVNADIRNLKTLLLSDVPNLYAINTSSTDYKGVRVLVQSLVQGILHFDQKTWNIYGTVDEGKTIKADPQVSESIKKLCEVFQLKTDSKFIDAEGKEFLIHGSPEIKGIKAGDGRNYVMDLMRLSPRDANFPDPVKHEACLLRPELIRNYKLLLSFENICSKEISEQKAKSEKDAEKKLEENSEKKDTAEVVEKNDAEVKELKIEEEKKDQPLEEKKEETENAIKNEEELLQENGFDGGRDKSLSLDSSLMTTLESKNESKTEDLDLLKKLSLNIKNSAIPYLINEFSSGANLAMIDKVSLIEEMHKLGINTRYLGIIHSMLNPSQHAFLKKLILKVVLMKSFVKYLREIVQENNKTDFAVLLAHCLNCLLGDEKTRANIDSKLDGNKAQKEEKNNENGAPKEEDSPKQQTSDNESKKKSKSKKKKKKPATLISADIVVDDQKLPDSSELFQSIKRIASEKYCLEISEKSFTELNLFKFIKEKISFIREVCRALGSVICIRSFETKEGQPEQQIRAKDFIEFRPITKCANFVLEGLRMNIKAGDAEIAAKNYDGATAIFKSYQQFVMSGYGIYNSDFIHITTKLASIAALKNNYELAIKQQLLAVKISEKVYGLDSHNTAQLALDLANFFYMAKKIPEALGLQGLALFLFDLIGGPLNPLSLIALHELQLMCNETKDSGCVTKVLEELLKRNAALFGETDERLLYILERLAHQKAEAGDFATASLLQARHSLIISRLLKGKGLENYQKLKSEMESKLSDSDRLRDMYIKKRDLKKEGKGEVPAEASKTGKKKTN